MLVQNIIILVQNIILLVQNIIMLVPNIIVLVLASITSAIQGTQLIGPDCCRGKLDEVENLIYPRIPDTPYSTHFAQRNVIFQWRRLNFFEISKDMDSGLGEDNVVTCAISGRGSIVLGDLKVNRRRWPGWLACYCDDCRAKSGC